MRGREVVLARQDTMSPPIMGKRTKTHPWSAEHTVHHSHERFRDLVHGTTVDYSEPKSIRYLLATCLSELEAYSSFTRGLTEQGSSMVGEVRSFLRTSRRRLTSDRKGKFKSLSAGTPRTFRLVVSQVLQTKSGPRNEAHECKKQQGTAYACYLSFSIRHRGS